jgi:hypothetical protein
VVSNLVSTATLAYVYRTSFYKLTQGVQLTPKSLCLLVPAVDHVLRYVIHPCGLGNVKSQLRTKRKRACNVAEQVRSIDVGAKMTPNGQIVQPYEVRIDATPQPYNIAHADIYAHPERATIRAFRLLREGLAALAE